MDFIGAAERLGIPVAILAVGAVAAWRLIGYLCKKVVEPITENHIEFIKTLSRSKELNAKTIESIGGCVKEQSVSLTRIEEQNDEILELANRNHIILIELRKQADAEAKEEAKAKA